jgi:threonine/homoserine/homoserine lactone efflux protein
MPQAVDPEKPMTRSTIATAGTATAAVSTVSVVAQVSQEVRTIKDSIGDILPWVVMAAAVVAIGLGAFAVVERIRQRRGGWA